MKHAITTTAHASKPAPGMQQTTSFRVCTDCALIIAYDDWTILDGSYSLDVADQREAQIRAGLSQHGALVVDVSDPQQQTDVFLTQDCAKCDCCGYRGGGPMWPATKEVLP